MCVLKTWLNAWTTSARMHDGHFDQCIFGCDHLVPDCLSHYIRCSKLWTFVDIASSSISSPSSPAQQTNMPSPAERLCLSDPSHRSFLLLVVAFTTYHALRADLLSRPRLPCQEDLEMRAQELARAAWRKFSDSSTVYSGS